MMLEGSAPVIRPEQTHRPPLRQPRILAPRGVRDALNRLGGRSLLAGDFYMSPTVLLCANPEYWPPVALAMRSTGLEVGACLRAIFTCHRLTTS